MHLPIGPAVSPGVHAGRQAQGEDAPAGVHEAVQPAVLHKPSHHCLIQLVLIDRAGLWQTPIDDSSGEYTTPEPKQQAIGNTGPARGKLDMPT